MDRKPESRWKTSNFERISRFLSKPFQPLIKLIIGVSEKDIEKKQALRELKKAGKKLKNAEKQIKEAAKQAKINAKEAEKKAARSGKEIKSEKEMPSPQMPQKAADLPEFFTRHPQAPAESPKAPEESLKEKDTPQKDTPQKDLLPEQETLQAAITENLEKTEEALDAELPEKSETAGIFKKIILFCALPFIIFRWGFLQIAKLSPASKSLRQHIKDEGFFGGIGHYLWDFGQSWKRRSVKKAEDAARRDPLGAGDEPLELLEFRSPTIAVINTPLPPLARYIIWTIGGLFSSMLLAMYLLPINKVVSISGRLVSKRPLMVIQATDPGIVLDIDAQVGDIIKKGQIVGVMDPRLPQAQLDAAKQELAIYKAQIARLKAEVADRPYIPDTSDPIALGEGKNYLHRQKDLHAQLEALEQSVLRSQSELQGAEASAAMYGSKLRIALELLRIRQAEQHHEVGTRLGTLQAQDAVMDAERELIGAQKTANGAKAELKGAQAKKDAYLQNWKAEAYTLLAQVEVKLSTAQAAYTKAAMQHDLVQLRAPEDGIVLSRGRIARGAVLNAGMPFMTLVPLKGGVEVIGAMSAEDSGYLKIGDHAIIKFATFPYDTYGGAEGKVAVISADSFIPQEAATENVQEAVMPPEGKGAGVFFRVKLDIDRYTLHGTPKYFHPGPGQVVTADVDIGTRTMMQYFFGNVKSNLTEGMREPSH